tara:strand:+ start:365 stop:1588 length:1224 start_codon:yes stop_codon:yes gene_type:complete
MSTNKSYKDSGILNFDRAYHFVKNEIASLKNSIQNIKPKVPFGKVKSENKPEDAQSIVSVQNLEENTNKPAKPSSFHFISVPTAGEFVPIYNYKDDIFYGNSLPIFDSLVNNAKVLPKGSKRFKPDFSINPLQVTPGDVVVQGRYGHGMMFSDAKGQPTFRIGNSFRSRPKEDVDQFLSDTPVLQKKIRSDVSMPIFYNPNIDGSSFYMLKRIPAGVDLDSETVLAKKKHYTDYKDNVLRQTFNDWDGRSDSKIFMSSDSLLFYTKGLNNNSGHDISMLSSGNIFLNSFRNVFITTPEITYKDNDVNIPEGRISLGSHRDPGTSPNSVVQPVVRGLNYQETISDILDTLKFITENFKNLADGGVAVDKDGSAVTGDAQAPIINLLNDKIDSIQDKLNNDLSKKVFTT